VIYEIAPFTMPPGRTMVPLRFYSWNIWCNCWLGSKNRRYNILN
jgi:hypothetical protein